MKKLLAALRFELRPDRPLRRFHRALFWLSVACFLAILVITFCSPVPD